MNNLSRAFYQAIQKGLDAAKLITEQDKKAMAYGSIANAIALTGLVEDGVIEAVDNSTDKETSKKTETKKAEPKKTTAKDALKPEANKGAATKPVEEKEEAAPIPEKTTTEAEVELDEEWTETMTTLKADQLTRLQDYLTNWTEDYIYNTCVPAFFEDTAITGGDNIRPTNIDGFITYLDQLAAQFATNEEQ